MSAPASTPRFALLEALLDRFNARVPFETVTKILRREDHPPSERIRDVAAFWADHLATGLGETCFGRVTAFGWLLGELGFDARPVLGRCGPRVFGESWGPVNHVALRVELDGRSWIADVGFPLPMLLEWRDAVTTAGSPLLDCAVHPVRGGVRVELLSGVPVGRPREIEIYDAAVSAEELRAAWDASFDPRTRLGSFVGVRRHEPTRVVAFARGELRIDDRFTRLTLPVGPDETAFAAHVLGVDTSAFARACSLAGWAPPTQREATLTAYVHVAEKRRSTRPPPVAAIPFELGHDTVELERRLEQHHERTFAVVEARVGELARRMVEDDDRLRSHLANRLTDEAKRFASSS